MGTCRAGLTALFIAGAIAASSCGQLEEFVNPTDTASGNAPDTIPPVEVGQVDNDAEGPSQSAGDAARDRVTSSMAALSYAERVRVVETYPTSEGLWALSKPSKRYSEVLLISGASIVRAYPFPAHPVDELLITPEAVYCAGEATEDLPNAVLCRIDRETLEATVRVFPPPREDDDPPPRLPIDTWILDEPTTVTAFWGLRVLGGELLIGSSRDLRLDPVSLEWLPEPVEGEDR